MGSNSGWWSCNTGIWFVAIEKTSWLVAVWSYVGVLEIGVARVSMLCVVARVMVVLFLQL